jgi:hypothetical protein
VLKPLIVPLIFTNNAAVDAELDERAIEDGAADESGVDDESAEEGATLVNELVASELMAIELAAIELMDMELELLTGFLSSPPPHAASASAAMAVLKRSIGNMKFSLC